MTLLVQNVTTPNADASFRNDVQIAHYRTPANADLVRRFMFTRGDGEGDGRKGTAELLDTLRLAALSSSTEARFLFVATYGHGKSHFGLAVANFFGKPDGSPETNALLGALDHALPPTRAQNFRDFKRYRAPYLVILLRGDEPGSLRDNFFRALDDALAEHATTRDVRPPFWFDEAQRVLDDLAADEERTRRADAFLAPQRLDLADLRRDVGDRVSSAYGRTVEIIRHVYGFAPDFGGETSLRAAVGWVVREFCGDHASGKPFGGVLVLFDEFSMFVRDYTMKNPHGVPLQELLEGVDDHRGRALFVGLSQHEPERVARGEAQDHENLLKQLTRLPKPGRARMHTLLEDVLRAYFKPNDDGWREMMGDRTVSTWMNQASDVAHEVMFQRYQEQLGWTDESFQTRVARGCFPLHPLTTALLSNLNLEEAGTVRSVLGLIVDRAGEVQRRFAEAAVVEGRPNWVLPITLVDYFGEMLGEDHHRNYAQVINADMPPGQQAVLKAMLLQTVAALPTRKVGYEVLIGQLAGLESHEAREHLRALENARYIRYDEGNRTYSFWAGSNGAVELEQRLVKEMEARQRSNTLHLLFEEFKADGNAVNRLGLGETYEVNVSWGNSIDWGAREVLLPVTSFTAQTLDVLQAWYAASIDKVPEGRGVVVVLIARTQHEVDDALTRVQTAFDKDVRHHEAPIVVLCPRQPTPALATALQKLALLNDLRFKHGAAEQIGAIVYEGERTRLRKQTEQALDKLRKGAAIEVPRAARARVASLTLSPRVSNGLHRALLEVYQIAYRKAPDAFYEQYRLATNMQLRTAVSDVVHVLRRNALENAELSPLPTGLIDNYIKRSWGLTTASMQLRSPDGTRVAEAWKHLDQTFSPQGDPVQPREVLNELLNAPYGYDYNTLALLFAA